MPFFDANQFENAAAVFMLTYDDNQRAQKALCRLTFSTQPKRFFLLLLVGLHGSTDTTARKSAIEEMMFWKVTLPSTLIFFAKDVCMINFTVSFYLYLYLQPCEKCFFFRNETDLVFCFLSWLVKFPALEVNSLQRRANSNPGN